jgi:Flp pilus assembly pilin Flp
MTTKSLIQRYCEDCSGATAVEYSMIAAGIMLAVSLTILSVGEGPVSRHFNSIVQGFLTLRN